MLYALFFGTKFETLTKNPTITGKAHLFPFGGKVNKGHVSLSVKSARKKNTTKNLLLLLIN